jgi:hypothetical protein
MPVSNFVDTKLWSAVTAEHKSHILLMPTFLPGNVSVEDSDVNSPDREVSPQGSRNRQKVASKTIQRADRGVPRRGAGQHEVTTLIAPSITMLSLYFTHCEET